MAQLLLLVAVGLVGWFGYKKMVKDAERVSKSVRRAKDETKTGASGTLVKDPKTGEYRVEGPDDEAR
ncbi:MAG: hypothetical protein P1V13_04645 [Rhizobiaceae bacterium]|nr:hypothetical protein [Rhizobiaceae bacterium]|tara:strand:+ start:152032 stop:152232 length:201 start_codon:yes stop_codon:yes gene_type:complete